MPFAQGRWPVANLENACAHRHPEHGHMSLVVAGLPTIVDALVDGT